MIWESHPWRDELCRVAERLERWTVAVDWDDEVTSFEMERDVMLSAYAVRKLLDAHKLADSTAAMRIGIDTFPLVDRVPDLMNWHRLDEFYDLAASSREELTLTELCNQVIHSFVFVPEVAFEGDEATETGGLAGFLVASDRARSSRLYRIDVQALTRLVRLVGTEDVVSTRMVRDAAGQWQVSNLTADELDRADPRWRGAADWIEPSRWGATRADRAEWSASRSKTNDSRLLEKLAFDGAWASPVIACRTARLSAECAPSRSVTAGPDC